MQYSNNELLGTNGVKKMNLIKTKQPIKLSKYISILIIIGLLVVGTILSDKFFQVSNFMNILQFAAEAGFVSVGMTLVILSGRGGIDLSVGSVMGIGCMTAAMMVSHGNPVWFSVVVAIAFGAGIGAVNGILITTAKLEPFIATLVTLTAGRSVVYFMSSGAPVIRHITDPFKMIAQGKLGIFPYPVVYLIVVFAVAGIIMKGTPFGRHIYAIGGSEETAKLFGIRTTFIKNTVYIISGALAAFAGIITSSRLGIGDPNAGLGYEMTAITMVVVGGTSMSGGKGSVIGTFFGMLMLSIMQNVLQLKKMSVHMSNR